MFSREGLVRLTARLTRRVPLRGTGQLLKKLHSPTRRSSSIEEIVRIDDGFAVHANTKSEVEWLLFFYGGARFERGIRRTLRNNLKPGDFAIDVGANVGLHTITMAKAVGSGRVAAFEPVSAVRRRLEANLLLNAIQNVDVYESAVGDYDGHAAINVEAADEDLSAYASLRANDRYLGTSVQTLTKITRLDTLFGGRGSPAVRLIKIDVEGLEPEVLKGAREILGRDAPTLVFEYDPEWWTKGGNTIRDVLAELTSLGYDSFAEVTDGGTRPLDIKRTTSTNILATAPHRGEQ